MSFLPKFYYPTKENLNLSGYTGNVAQVRDGLELPVGLMNLAATMLAFESRVPAITKADKKLQTSIGFSWVKPKAYPESIIIDGNGNWNWPGNGVQCSFWRSDRSIGSFSNTSGFTIARQEHFIIEENDVAAWQKAAGSNSYSFLMPLLGLILPVLNNPLWANNVIERIKLAFCPDQLILNREVDLFSQNIFGTELDPKQRATRIIGNYGMQAILDATIFNTPYQPGDKTNSCFPLRPFFSHK